MLLHLLTAGCVLWQIAVISLLRSNLAASGVKRTSITEPDLATS